MLIIVARLGVIRSQNVKIFLSCVVHTAEYMQVNDSGRKKSLVQVQSERHLIQLNVTR